MKIELVLIDREKPDKKVMIDVELPAVPQKGDTIALNDGMESYEVSHATYRFDEDGKFIDRVTVDAWSLWNSPGQPDQG